MYYDPSGVKVGEKKYRSLREKGYTSKEAYDILKKRVKCKDLKPNPNNEFKHNISGYCKTGKGSFRIARDRVTNL